MSGAPGSADLHDPDCMCARCLMEDLDASLVEQGRDPAAYWVERPTKNPAADGTQRQRIVPRRSAPAQLKRNAEPHSDPIPSPRGHERVRMSVPVLALAPGIWARFTGVGVDGSPATIAGAIIGGPQPVGGTAALVLLVRDYRNPDVLLFVDEDGRAEMVDDRADHQGRAVHAVAAFQPGAAARHRAEFQEAWDSAQRRGLPSLTFEGISA